MAYATTQRRVRIKAGIRLIMYGLLAMMFFGQATYWGGTVPNVMWVWTAFAVWKVRKWLRVYRAAEQFPRYVLAMDTTVEHRTEELARRLNQSQEVVIRNLQQMSTLGLLPPVVAEKDGLFVLSGAKSDPLHKWQEAASNREKQREPSERGVRCDSCGAQNRVIVGKSNPCPYCGTLLTPPETPVSAK